MKKTLVFQGCPFHYEMIGFILDVATKYPWEITWIILFPNTPDGIGWISLYQQKYPCFSFSSTLPSKDEIEKNYDFILLLTDDDQRFPYSFLVYFSSKMICIDHYYQIRTPEIPISNHIRIGPLHSSYPHDSNHQQKYALPIFEYISNAIDKSTFTKNVKKPILTLLGGTNLPFLSRISSIITNFHDFDIFVINRRIPLQMGQNLPHNIFLLSGISTESLFNVLEESMYLGLLCDESNDHYHLYSQSASISLSFSFGCRLLIPKAMNINLQSTSAFEYENVNTPFYLETSFSLESIFEERKHFINLRDTCLLEIFS